MKKLILNFIGILILSIISVYQSYAQMTPCAQAACSPACMDITVVNNLYGTNCNLSLYWHYGGCTYPLGFDYPIGVGGSPTHTGPCAKCPGSDDCECPDKIMLVDETSANYWPWGDFPTMLANGNSTYTSQANICSSCPNGLVDVAIVITGPNSATITFTCN